MSEERVFVGKLEELPEEGGVKVEAFGSKIALFKHEGSVHAIDDTCPHRRGPLHVGRVVDGAVVCPLHGWAFDLFSGEKRGDTTSRVSVYTVETDESDVFLKRPSGA